METALLARVRRVELYRHEGVWADLPDLGEHIVWFVGAHCHNEVGSDAFDPIGQDDGIHVVRERGRRVDKG